MPKRHWTGAATETELDDDEQAAYAEEYDRQIELGERQADNRAVIEEAAYFDSPTEVYWDDQRYAAAFFEIYGCEPE